MRISYHTTSSFIRHTGTLVDLGEYRRKLALSQSDSLARQPQPRRWEAEELPAFHPKVLPSRGRPSRGERSAWALDTAASVAVIVMTLAFLLWMAL